MRRPNKLEFITIATLVVLIVLMLSFVGYIELMPHVCFDPTKGM